MSVCETSAAFNAIIGSLCCLVYWYPKANAFTHQIIVNPFRDSLLWSAGLATSVWTPRCSPQLYRMSHLRDSGKFYPAATTRSMVVCYVREQVQFPHVSNLPSFTNLFSSTSLLFLDNQFIATIVIYERVQEVKSQGLWEKNRWESVRRGCEMGERKQMLWWRVREREGRSRDRKWFGFLTDGSQSRTEIPRTSKPPPVQLPTSYETVWRTFLLHFCLITPSSHPSLSLSVLSLFNLFFVPEETLETRPLALR